MVKNIPQANDLDKVIDVFTYVYMHPGCHLQEVSDYIGFSDRQGRYYFHACEYLGLVTKENHSITPLGREIWENSPLNVAERVYERIMTDEVMGQVFAHGLLFPKDDLEAFSRTVVAAYYPDLTSSDTTFERRCNVIVKWVTRILNYVKLKNK